MMDAMTMALRRMESATYAELNGLIHRGRATFMEVGFALMAMRDGKKYKEGGYCTFEDYCQKEHGFDRTYGHRLMVAAETAGMLPHGNISEWQVRPLTQLRKDPEALEEAWERAQELAEQQHKPQPSRDDVQQAVKEVKGTAPRRDKKPPKPLFDQNRYIEQTVNAVRAAVIDVGRIDWERVEIQEWWRPELTSALTKLGHLKEVLAAREKGEEWLPRRRRQRMAKLK